MDPVLASLGQTEAQGAGRDEGSPPRPRPPSALKHVAGKTVGPSVPQMQLGVEPDGGLHAPSAATWSGLEARSAPGPPSRDTHQVTPSSRPTTTGF